MMTISEEDFPEGERTINDHDRSFGHASTRGRFDRCSRPKSDVRSDTYVRTPVPDNASSVAGFRPLPGGPLWNLECGGASPARNHLVRRRVDGPILPFRHMGRRKNQQERAMNWDRVEGNWKQFKGQLQQKWGKLTDDDLDVIEGKRTELAGRLQQRYGYAKDEADKNIDSWLKDIH